MSRYIDAEKLKVENRKHFPSLSLRCELNYIINEIPTADVKPIVHGEWIEDGYQGYPCVCSVCGTPQEIKAKFLFSFCPNCGADMRPSLEIRDCDCCKHYVTRDGQTGCEKWECEFERKQ